MTVSFSVDLHDKDGDVYIECLLLHIGDCVIIKLDKNGLNDFINSLKQIQRELKENYDIKFDEHLIPDTHAADIETVREALVKVDEYRGYEWLEMGSQKERDIASSVRSALAALDRLEGRS